MLPLLLMLVSDPLAPPPPDTSTHPEIRLRVIGDPRISRCDGGGFQRIELSAGQHGLLRNELTHTRNDEVRRYLLLERTVRGCPAPISYALPDRQGGFIRDLGRDRPVPSDRGRFQPPRSSE